jgi:hypothetical protein
LHSFACPSSMAPSKFHVHLHSRVSNKHFNQIHYKESADINHSFLVQQIWVILNVNPDSNPISLPRFGTTCSPLSLEDPNAWKLHIACSNSGL